MPWQKKPRKNKPGNPGLLDAFFAEHREHFEWVRPVAGPIGFPKIKFGRNAEEFCTDVVEKQGVMLLPSTGYDIGDEHFRLGIGRKNRQGNLKK